jgi:hypothetical protein
MWAHAEYIKLLRSASDGKVFDLIPAVADRYQHRCDCTKLEIWQPGGTARGTASDNLRIRPSPRIGDSNEQTPDFESCMLGRTELGDRLNVLRA